ncbi:glycosyltransferase [Buttiauxella sp. WJP83]|uniref:glycosyltransferase family 2 protein n=1 Tax=Buttiauxella sp. WJP83 TaxID=2986951 RepID=UPI0022DE0F7E|nr:glycosyltransferase family 2 protein [Buttiauxella sp. WJP83]WBM70855.1 glycosyltransferase [Buttiauxella sp. WJP83]
MMEKSLSVVVPIYNSAKYIKKTIDSIIEAAKGYVFEIILVDDVSSDIDIVLEIIQSIGNVRVIKKNSKSNASDSRNIGFLNSKYNNVFFLDSDDYFTPNYVKSRLSVMEVNNVGVYFGCFILNINDDVKVMSKNYNDGVDMREFIFSQKGDFRSSTISIDKRYHKGTLFDSLQYKHQDWGFGIRCYDADERMLYDNQSLVQINCGANIQMSNSMNISASEYFINTYLNDKKFHSSFVRLHYFNAFYNKDLVALEYFTSLTKECGDKLFYMYVILLFMSKTKMHSLVEYMIRLLFKIKNR